MDNRSVYQKHQAGKGSRRRPCNEQAYREQMDKIFPDKVDPLENRDLSWLEEEETDGSKS